MTAFWIVAGIFIVTALLFILPALLRGKQVASAGVENDDANVGVYRDQLVELKNDLRNDILSEEQYDKSRQELEQRLLLDIPGKKSMVIPVSKQGRSIVTSSILVLAIPLSAVLLYLTIGDTRGLLPQVQLANAVQFQSTNSGGSGPPGHSEFSSVVGNLVARLADNPEDTEGWVMLARTYAIMGRFDEATSTYEKLVELVPDNPQILSDYADVLAVANQGVLAGKPAELIYLALRLDPEYPKALALAGTVEFEQKQFDSAADYWERLLAVIPSESELAKSVSGSIAEARSLASGETTLSALPQQIATSTATDQSVTDDDAMDAAPHEKMGGMSISGSVSLAQSIANKASPNDTLFIYARAKTGPKMPLAILRLKASDLPASFSLNDDMAMIPTMKISSFPEVIIEARISKSGQAIPTIGDLQGFSNPVKLGDKGVSIVINKRVL